MSVHDELAQARHALDDLARVVDRLQGTLGDGLDVRRARADTARLRDDLDLLRQSAADDEPLQGAAQPDVVFIARTPYDPSMWVGCEDEGVGSRHGPEVKQGHPSHRLLHRTPRTR